MQQKILQFSRIYSCDDNYGDFRYHIKTYSVIPLQQNIDYILCKFTSRKNESHFGKNSVFKVLLSKPTKECIFVLR